MTYTYQEDHNTPDFVDITDPMSPVRITYAQFQDLAPQWKPYPADWRSQSIEQHLAEDPEFVNIRRLYIADEPHPDHSKEELRIALYEIAEIQPIALNGVTGRYEQTYTVRTRTEPEMDGVTLRVEAKAIEWRTNLGGSVVQHNDLNVATDNDSLTKLSARISSLNSTNERTTIQWENQPDSKGRRRQYPATVEDLQALEKKVFLLEQVAYDATDALMAAQDYAVANDIEESFASDQDVLDFLNDFYNTNI